MEYTSPSRTLHSVTANSLPERICITYTHRDKLKPWPGAEGEALSNSHLTEKRSATQVFQCPSMSGSTQAY